MRSSSNSFVCMRPSAKNMAPRAPNLHSPTPNNVNSGVCRSAIARRRAPPSPRGFLDKSKEVNFGVSLRAAGRARSPFGNSELFAKPSRLSPREVAELACSKAAAKPARSSMLHPHNSSDSKLSYGIQAEVDGLDVRHQSQHRGHVCELPAGEASMLEGEGRHLLHSLNVRPIRLRLQRRLQPVGQARIIQRGERPRSLG
mmetsp:Transcript_9567/g.29544  ORF Transcript_9567/g.29544 Transcript_9567/m.29544 type:complete len:200 (-) Transcript_9567:124-723(-)